MSDEFETPSEIPLRDYEDYKRAAKIPDLCPDERRDEPEAKCSR